jgi:hypothetical protein
LNNSAVATAASSSSAGVANGAQQAIAVSTTAIRSAPRNATPARRHVLAPLHAGKPHYTPANNA